MEKVCDFEISYGILGIDDCCKQDRVLTLMIFLIYKEWLSLSLEGKKRSNNTNREKIPTPRIAQGRLRGGFPLIAGPVRGWIYVEILVNTTANF